MSKPLPIKIIREASDPMALRASIGGNEDIGFYLTYRGDPAAVTAMLKKVVEAFEIEQGVRRARRN